MINIMGICPYRSYGQYGQYGQYDHMVKWIIWGFGPKTNYFD